MDCREVEKYSGDAIDKFLPQNVDNEFQAHLERCKPCRREIALERLSKHVVRRHVTRISTPISTRTLVLNTLVQEHEGRGRGSLPANVFPTRIVIPALSGGIVALIFFLLVSARTDPSYRQTAHNASNDIINQSFKNFALLQAGKLEPEMVSSVAESVGDFFRRSNLQFGVEIQKFESFGSCGASASECSGVKQAHLVYKIGNDWIYVFEVSDDDALYGTRVSLPVAAKRALAQSGWYTDPDHPDCNVVLWKTDEAVCVAVSTMKKGRLLALLTAP